MKRIVIIVMLMLLMTGCNRNGNDATNDSANNNQSNDTNETTPNDQQSYTERNQSWYDQFESGLKKSQVTYSAKTSLDPTSVGGAEGYRYVTEGGNIDVYRFDEGEELDRIKKEKTLDIDGERKNVTVSDNMVIVSDNLSQDILDMFQGLKKETFE